MRALRLEGTHFAMTQDERWAALVVVAEVVRGEDAEEDHQDRAAAVRKVRLLRVEGRVEDRAGVHEHTLQEAVVQAHGLRGRLRSRS